MKTCYFLHCLLCKSCWGVISERMGDFSLQVYGKCIILSPHPSFISVITVILFKFCFPKSFPIWIFDQLIDSLAEYLKSLILHRIIVIISLLWLCWQKHREKKTSHKCTTFALPQLYTMKEPEFPGQSWVPGETPCTTKIKGCFFLF